jgi:hypothetical protein
MTMFWVEQWGFFVGPYEIEEACKRCGWLNFFDPGTASVRTADGGYAQ